MPDAEEVHQEEQGQGQNIEILAIDNVVDATDNGIGRRDNSGNTNQGNMNGRGQSPAEQRSDVVMGDGIRQLRLLQDAFPRNIPHFKSFKSNPRDFLKMWESYFRMGQVDTDQDRMELVHMYLDDASRNRVMQWSTLYGIDGILPWESFKERMIFTYGQQVGESSLDILLQIRQTSTIEQLVADIETAAHNYINEFGHGNMAQTDRMISGIFIKAIKNPEIQAQLQEKRDMFGLNHDYLFRNAIRMERTWVKARMTNSQRQGPKKVESHNNRRYDNNNNVKTNTGKKIRGHIIIFIDIPRE